VTKVIALVSDLIFLSRIREAAKATAAEVTSVKRGDALIQACRQDPPALVLVDLDDERAAPVESVRALRAEPSLAKLTIVGFVSHVHAERAKAAQEAGCSRVLARGAFVAELPALLGASD